VEDPFSQIWSHMFISKSVFHLFLGGWHSICHLYNGSQLSIINVISGVPQGTVLGPLFLVYINNLPDCVSLSCSLLADDCLSVVQTYCIHTVDGSHILQDDFSRIEEWVDKWMMVFNADKCEVLQVTLSLKPSSYFLYNSQLRTIGHAKYLGELLDSKLKFNYHIATICIEKLIVC